MLPAELKPAVAHGEEHEMQMKLHEDCQKELAHLQAELKLRDGQAWAEAIHIVKNCY